MSAELSVQVRLAGLAPGRPRLDVDLAFDPGISAILGPSGAGKSTLLAVIAGLLRPERGLLRLAGELLLDLERGIFVPPHRRRVALVFQSLALFPHLRSWENVAYGLAHRPRRERRGLALRWLECARVPHAAERFPAELSGGEQQRVALARALASEPRALLLDEPFSALDDGLRGELGVLLRGLMDEAKIPALLVTHHEEDARRLAARTVRLRDGRPEG